MNSLSDKERILELHKIINSLNTEIIQLLEENDILKTKGR